MLKKNSLLAITAIGLVSQTMPSVAAELEEIVVTARKREESILKVPVVETAISQKQLERFQINDVLDLPNLVPGLVVGHAVLSTGALLSIRGVGTTALDPGVDQSVSFNIDGLPLFQGLAFMSGTFDLQQIEVLKGPQTLFYGKSSPAGVISLRTADPTDKTEIIARAAYEFEARNPRTELIASGPVTDTLKLRLAGMYSQADGYFHNDAVAVPFTGAANPSSSRNPDAKNWMVRGTALWNPSDQFNARLKLNYVRDRSNNPENGQVSSCPDGTAAVPRAIGGSGIPFITGDDCKLNRSLRLPDYDPAAFPGVKHGGVPYGETEQMYGVLELNYDMTSDLSLNSTTGYYDLDASNLFNTTVASAAAPALSSANDFSRHDFTQELRLNSDFSGALNFTVGGFYQKSEFVENVILGGNTAYLLPASLAYFRETIPIEAYSTFGQLRWKVLPELELAGGLRWSDETRKQTVLADVPSRTAIPSTVPRLHSTNTSPEFTITYTPTDDLTLFGAYKKGYKSGSYGVSTPSATPTGWDSAFGQEKVKGGEIGLKSRLLDRQLAFNVAAYDYRFDGLQVGIVPAVSGTVAVKTVNAGAARTYGVEFDSSYRVAAIDGLDVNAALGWNHARYTTLDNIPCWGGQTIAQGCNLNFGPSATAPAGSFRAQSLSGSPMVRAPAWQGNVSFSYELPVGSDYTLTLTNSNAYSSKYVTTLATGRPNDDQYQKSYVKVDVGIELKAPDERFEVSLLAKNVNDKVTAGTCSNSNSQNGVLFGGQITGGTGVGPAGVDEIVCFSDPGREIWLRGTYRLAIDR